MWYKNTPRAEVMSTSTKRITDVDHPQHDDYCRTKQNRREVLLTLYRRTGDEKFRVQSNMLRSFLRVRFWYSLEFAGILSLEHSTGRSPTTRHQKSPSGKVSAIRASDLHISGPLFTPTTGKSHKPGASTGVLRWNTNRPRSYHKPVVVLELPLG
jgi:hypothetical protein